MGDPNCGSQSLDGAGGQRGSHPTTGQAATLEQPLWLKDEDAYLGLGMHDRPVRSEVEEFVAAWARSIANLGSPHRMPGVVKMCHGLHGGSCQSRGQLCSDTPQY